MNKITLDQLDTMLQETKKLRPLTKTTDIKKSLPKCNKCSEMILMMRI